MSETKTADLLPGFWMHETSGVLRPAVEAYLAGGHMTAMQIAAMRAYLRQWIDAPVWKGDAIAPLRRGINDIVSRDDICRWIDAAVEAGLDPL